MKPFPNFSDANHLDPDGMKKLLKLGRTWLDEILEKELPASQPEELMGFKNKLLPLLDLMEKINDHWLAIDHLKNVLGDPKIVKYYEDHLNLVNDFLTSVNQDQRFYQSCLQIKDHEYPFLFESGKKMIEDQLRSFRLNGMMLPEEKKERYKTLKKELSELSHTFSKNVLEDTDESNWFFPDDSELKEIPPIVLERAHLEAVRKGLIHQSEEKGYLFTLKFNSYFDFMCYQPIRKHREKLYRAYMTRATSGERDNTVIIEQILLKRQQLAETLGFENYGEVALQNRLAKRSEEVFDFLNNLLDRSISKMGEEKNQLEKLLREDLTSAEEEVILQPYDLAYYSTKLKKLNYDLDNEEVKHYFTQKKVLSGLFELVERLFDCSFELNRVVKGWHEEVLFYDVFRRNGREKDLIGHLYCDFFSRSGKREGAWMDSQKTRKRVDPVFESQWDQVGLELFTCEYQLPKADIQLPVAYLVTNFTPPDQKGISLLSHQDVATLFHEMGHVLHHLLTEQEYLPISGINGVPWDAVELPSQFLENWVWDWDLIQLISEHKETKEKLPRTLFDKMVQAKNFNAGLNMLNQLKLGLFDLEVHCNFLEHCGSKNWVEAVFDRVEDQTRLIKAPDYARLQNFFLHIFDGAYAAGYYSYKWAEVMSADAFSVFLEQGIFNQQLSRRFRDSILAGGGSCDFLDLYLKFKGNKPTIDALLKQRGL